VYVNRMILRPSEYTLVVATGTLTFTAGLIAEDDEIEVTGVTV
jgi:hypothetical protein